MALGNEKQLDEIGWHLLRELQRNARLSFAELGRRVGLSVPAVTERVRRLEDAGVITGYHAEIAPEKIGFPITAFIRMTINSDVTAKLTKTIQELSEVRECHRGTGGDSFILKVNVASVAHLESLIDRLLGFGTTTTSIVLSSPVTRQFIERPLEDARNVKKQNPDKKR